MAREMIAAAVLAALTSLGATAAVAQSYDQLQNRYQLQESQRQLDQSSSQRQFDQDRQSQNIQNRIENQALERRLEVPRYRPPVGGLNNPNRY